MFQQDKPSSVRGATPSISRSVGVTFRDAQLCLGGLVVTGAAVSPHLLTGLLRPLQLSYAALSTAPLAVCCCCCW